MEFLVIAHYKESFITSAPQSVLRQVLTAHRDMVRRQKEAGKIVKINELNGWQRLMIIYECDGPQEFQKLIGEVPFGGAMFSYEVYNLADYEELMKVILEGMEKGDEMTPGGAVK